MDWTTVDDKPKIKKVKKQYVDGEPAGAGRVYDPFKQDTSGLLKGPPEAPKRSAAGVGIPPRELDEEHFEEIKYETVSHVLSEGVKKARAGKSWTQAQLAKAINAKASVVHDIENGSARYDAGIINAIERATGV